MIMSDSKKIKYLSKTVAFGGKTLTLFSIDGQTWSSRKQELLEIKERQERDKVSFVAIKEENGETRVAPKVKGKTPIVADDDEEAAAVILDEAIDYPVVDYSIDEEKAPKGRGKKALKLNLKAKAVKQDQPKKQFKALPANKKAAKSKEKKKTLKIVPKKRVTAKPAVKSNKKSKKKAA